MESRDELDEGLADAHDNNAWPEMSARGAWAIFVACGLVIVAVCFLIARVL